MKLTIQEMKDSAERFKTGNFTEKDILTHAVGTHTSKSIDAIGKGRDIPVDMDSAVQHYKTICRETNFTYKGDDRDVKRKIEDFLEGGAK